MKIRISIVMFLLISFLNMGAISDVPMIEDSFNNLEVTAVNQSEFKENGVKLQYRTEENIEKEALRVRNSLTGNIIGDYSSVGKNEFKLLNNDFNINIKLWNENKYTYVEIILVNTNSQYKTTNLKNLLRKLENQKSKSVQYFLYYEGKIKESNNNQIINGLTYGDNIKEINLLNINNGCTGTGYLSNGEKVNFALTSYNTGSYIIIGTPIIFATY